MRSELVNDDNLLGNEPIELVSMILKGMLTHHGGNSKTISEPLLRLTWLPPLPSLSPFCLGYLPEGDGMSLSMLEESQVEWINIGGDATQKLPHELLKSARIDIPGKKVKTEFY